MKYLKLSYHWSIAVKDIMLVFRIRRCRLICDTKYDEIWLKMHGIQWFIPQGWYRYLYQEMWSWLWHNNCIKIENKHFINKIWYDSAFQRDCNCNCPTLIAILHALCLVCLCVVVFASLCLCFCIYESCVCVHLSVCVFGCFDPVIFCKKYLSNLSLEDTGNGFLTLSDFVCVSVYLILYCNTTACRRFTIHKGEGDLSSHI